MERELTDVNVKELSSDKISEMEDRRLNALDEAGINEVDVLKRANDNLHVWTSYFGENITRGKDDVNFVYRDQWTAVERSEFTRLFKPAMTFNKLYDATKKVIGEQRKNKPDLIVRSLTGHASEEQLNLRGDLVRTISYQSQNDLIYQTAFRSALTLGFGAFQICLDYENSRSFDKIIRFDIINDPTMCAWDPTATKPHKGDGNYCSRRYILTRDEFFATYPYVLNPVSFVDPNTILDYQWQTRDTIALCDEWVKEWYPLTIYKLSNNMVVDEQQWKDAQEVFKKQKQIVEGSVVAKIIEKGMPRIVGERQTQDYRIMHYRMIRDRIIDFSVWPSKHLPIPFVDGDSAYIEGRQYTKSFVHEARDAQKALNYSRSETMAEIKNRRREQWIGTADNIVGYEQDWRNPELQMGMLRAKPDPKTGQLPQKMPAWEISQGLFAVSSAATQDLNEILGFSENEALVGKDISGKARRERKLEGSMSAYVWFDNLNQAIEQGGRCVNDLLDHIIGDDERHFVLSMKDGKSRSVIINERKDDKILNPLVTGDFDVEIDTGPSFAVQKDMALEFLQQTLQAYPQAFPLIADLWAKNLDVQFMPQMAERFKTLVPPQILAEEEGKQLPPQPPSPQEQMMQMEMQSKQAAIQQKAQEIQLKEQQLELDKAELMMKANEMRQKSQLDIYNHQANIEEARITHHRDMHKTDRDFASKIAKMLTDVHIAERKGTPV